APAENHSVALIVGRGSPLARPTVRIGGGARRVVGVATCLRKDVIAEERQLAPQLVLQVQRQFVARRNARRFVLEDRPAAGDRPQSSSRRRRVYVPRAQ